MSTTNISIVWPFPFFFFFPSFLMGRPHYTFNKTFKQESNVVLLIFYLLGYQLFILALEIIELIPTPSTLT